MEIILLKKTNKLALVLLPAMLRISVAGGQLIHSVFKEDLLPQTNHEGKLKRLTNKGKTLEQVYTSPKLKSRAYKGLFLLVKMASISINLLYLQMRSGLVGAPDFINPQPNPTAMSAMVVSRVSPER